MIRYMAQAGDTAKRKQSTTTYAQPFLIDHSMPFPLCAMRSNVSHGVKVPNARFMCELTMVRPKT